MSTLVWFNSYMFRVNQAPGGAFTFARIIDGSGNDSIQGVACDYSGNLYICGTYTNTATIYDQAGNVLGTLPSSTGIAAFFSKFYKDGTYQYSRIVDSSSTTNDSAFGIACDRLGNVYFGGYYYNASATIRDQDGNTLGTLPSVTLSGAFMSKFDQYGTYQYTRLLESSTDDITFEVTCDLSNNVYMTGRYRGSSANIITQSGTVLGTLPTTSYDTPFFVKFDSLGNYQYTRSIQSIANHISASSSACDSLNNVYMIGTYAGTCTIRATNSSNVTSNVGVLPVVTVGNIFCSKFDYTGAYQYTILVNNPNEALGYIVSCDSLNNVYVGGTYWGANSSTLQIINSSNVTSNIATLPVLTTSRVAIACKFDSNGTYQYTRAVDANFDDFCIGMCTDSNNNFYMGGSYWVNSANIYAINSSNVLTTLGTLPNTSSRGTYVSKFDSTGTYQYSRTLDGSGNDDGSFLCFDNLDSFYFGGTYSGTPTITAVSNSNTYTTITTLPAASNAAAFTCKFTTDSNAPSTYNTGTYSFARIIDSSTGSDIAYSVTCDTNGYTYLAGYYTGTATIKNQNGTILQTLPVSSNNAGFVCKFTPIGDFQYARIFDAANNEISFSVACDSTQSIYVAGFRGSSVNTLSVKDQNGTTLGTLPSSSTGFIFFSKFDSFGTFLYSRTIITGSGYTNTPQPSVSCDSSDSVYLTGSFVDASTIASVTIGGVSTTVGTLPASSLGAGITNSVVCKFNSSGVYQYSRIVDSLDTVGTTCVTCDSSSNMYFGGITYLGSTIKNVTSSNVVSTVATLPALSLYGSFLCKFNSSGTYQYSFIVDASGNDTGYSVACDLSNNVYFAGQYNGTIVSPRGIRYVSSSNVATTVGTLPDTTQFGGFCCKFNSSGTYLYSRLIDTTSNSDASYSVTCDFSGNMYLAGFYNTGPALIRYVTSSNVVSNVASLPSVTGDATYCCKFNPIGTYLYSKVIDSSASDSGWSVFCDRSENLYLSGRYNGTPTVYNVSSSNVSTIETTLPASSGNDVAFLLKFNSDSYVDISGRYQYARILFDNSTNDFNYSVKTDSGGNVYYIGFYTGSPSIRDDSGATLTGVLPASSSEDGFVIKFNSNGVFQFSRTINGSGSDSTNDVFIDSAGNVYFSGTCAGSSAINIKDQNGTVLATLPSTAGYSTAFVSKFNSFGVYQYSRTVYGNGINNTYGAFVTCDSSDNVYFSGTIASASTIKAINSSNVSTDVGTFAAPGGQAAFVCKFDSFGTYLYSRTIDSSGSEYTQGIGCDSIGNLYFSTIYAGSSTTIKSINSSNVSTTVGTLPDSVGGFSGCISKFDASGTYMYSRIIDSVNNDYTGPITFDTSNSVYFLITYSGTPNILAVNSSNVVTNIGSLPQTTVNNNSSGFMKFDSSGNYQYTRFLSSTRNQTGRNIGSDLYGNIYMSGDYRCYPLINDQNGNVLGTLPHSVYRGAFISQFDSLGTFRNAVVLDQYSIPYQSGLIFSIYPGYFNDNVSFFASTAVEATGTTTNFTNVNTSTNGIIPGANIRDSYSVQWIGKFYATETGTWTFYTVSDDASYLWIGSTADSGFTTTNALVQNGGIHGMQERSGSISLVAGTYYSIRIQFGDNNGGDDINVSFTRPSSGTRIYDGTGYYFNLPGSNYGKDSLMMGVSCDRTGTLYGSGMYTGNLPLIKDQTGKVIGITPSSLAYGAYVLKFNQFRSSNISVQYSLDVLSQNAKSNINNAYALKRLLSTYTGPVVNVRRNSDNALIDIYSDANGNLTTLTGNSYTTWLGGATGYVTIWYDQSGNGRHATQPNMALQPKLLTSNIIDFSGYGPAGGEALRVSYTSLPANNTQQTITFKGYMTYTNSTNENGIMCGGTTGSGGNANIPFISSPSGSSSNYSWSQWGAAAYYGTYLANQVVTTSLINNSSPQSVVGTTQGNNQTVSIAGTLTVNGNGSNTNDYGLLAARDMSQGESSMFSRSINGCVDYLVVFKSLLSDYDKIVAEGIYPNMAPINYILNSLSNATKTRLRGVWSLQILFTESSVYPVVQLQNSAGTVVQDFYGSSSGTLLTTGVNGTGTTVSSWMSTNSITTAYVKVWYDQSRYVNGGTAYNATAVNSSGTTTPNTTLPFLNMTTKPWSIDNTSGGWFTLPSGTVVGNGTYTFSSCTNYGNSPGGIIGGGPAVINQINSLRWNGNTGYQNYWGNNDFNYALGAAVPTPATTTVITWPTTQTQGSYFTGGSTSTVYTTTAYINRSLISTNSRTNWSFITGNDVLMKTTADVILNSQMYWCLNSSFAIPESDRIIVESISPINPAINYPLDGITTAAKTNMRGAWSLQILFTESAAYPVVQVQNSAGTVVQNFYGSVAGNNLTTGTNGTGTTLSSWISTNGTAYIKVWYDQSYYARGSTGTQYNATAVNSSGTTTPNTTLPFVNRGTFPWSIDNTSGGWFTLPSGTVVGNGTYTFSTKTNYGNSPGGIIGGGANVINQINSLRWNGNTGYQNYWGNNDFNYALGAAVPTPATTTVINYNSGNSPSATLGTTFSGGSTSTVYTTNGYINTTLAGTSTRNNWSFTTGNDVLMKTTADLILNSQMYWCINSSQAICDNDRVIIESMDSSAAYVTRGLVAYYDFSRNSYSGSGTTLSDLSGNGYTATLNSAGTYNTSPFSMTWTTSMYAGTSSFPTTNFTTSGLTLEVVLYPTSLSNGPTPLALSAGGTNFINMFINSNGSVGLVNNTLTPAGVVTSNTWNHIVITWTNSTTQTVYVNNVPISVTNQTNISSSVSNIWINNYGTTGNFGTAGNFALARIYNRPLTELEINQNYSNIKLNNKYPLFGTYSLEYPPVALTGNVMTVSNHTYGNGAYIVSRSSAYQASDESWKAFNKVYGGPSYDGWNAALNNYDSTTGVFNGSTSSPYNRFTSLTGSYGDWIQIQFPSSINIKSYIIYTRESPYTYMAPTSFYILGSNDNTNWSIIDTRSGLTWSTAFEGKAFYLTTSENVYSYFAILINSVGPNNPFRCANVTEWRIFGNPPINQPISNPVYPATGGTITNYTVGTTTYALHTFDTVGTFNFTNSQTLVCDILIVAGGGGGGASSDRTAGGGGAGGVIYLRSNSLSASTYSVVVGSGGAGGFYPGGTANGSNGGNSSFGALGTAIGGGFGAGTNNATAGSGGSGGGICHQPATAGSGTSGQGFSGGTSSYDAGTIPGSFSGSGGGGAGGQGGNGTSAGGGAGGIGIQNSITGTALYYAGGGGGGTEYVSVTPVYGGPGGLGGGGCGGTTYGPSGASIAVNGQNASYYGGGGGGGAANSTTTTFNRGGNGYSGIVIVRYKLSS